jgi:hypothetical protein
VSREWPRTFEQFIIVDFLFLISMDPLKTNWYCICNIEDLLWISKFKHDLVCFFALRNYKIHYPWLVLFYFRGIILVNRIMNFILLSDEIAIVFCMNFCYMNILIRLLWSIFIIWWLRRLFYSQKLSFVLAAFIIQIIECA